MTTRAGEGLPGIMFWRKPRMAPDQTMPIFLPEQMAPVAECRCFCGQRLLPTGMAMLITALLPMSMDMESATG